MIFKARNNKVPFFKQRESKDCGPSCLKAILVYYGQHLPIETIRSQVSTNREGSSLYNLACAARKLGFEPNAAKLSMDELTQAQFPCIIHWNQNHYVVLYKIKRGFFYIMDPAIGYLKISEYDFIKNWCGVHQNSEEGIALFLNPGEGFGNKKNENDKASSADFSFLLKYFILYKKLIFQLVLGLSAGTILQFLIPFLTQSVVDIGIKNQDIGFVYLVLIAQVFVFIGRTALEIIRGWILLHLSTKISISLISDFFRKLMDLPISFFDTKMTGDIMQRIGDHKRLERILTTSTLSTIFSAFSFLVFGFILAYYNIQIFLVFIIGTMAYFGWTLYFFKKRKVLDYLRFKEFGKEQSKVIEIINGMQEIKLHNAENRMRWGWEKIQINLWKVGIKNLTLEQKQSTGSMFINELKNILITILCAKLVIEQEITLGMMLAVSSIVGQLNAPVSQMIYFLRDVQDAKIALERLGEIHNKEDETQQDFDTSIVSEVQDLTFENVSFRYGVDSKIVLNAVNFKIPKNKVTAIVGESGSGKTTLLKLIMRFYSPQQGSISFGTSPLKLLNLKSWRNYCGAVMQEGYIFNDTIGRNISFGTEEYEHNAVIASAKVANIHEFVNELPLGYETIIGSEGVQISTGQKQRVLIARAVHKNPKLLIFDEATSSLDTKNEKIIVNRLNEVFENRTVVVVAHRLSTVKNADNIIVLDKGNIIESGTHAQLIANKKEYFNLVSNQLELGK